MTIEHNLEITLSSEDVAKIVVDHLNKGLSKDFTVSVDAVNFNIASVPDRNDIDHFVNVLTDITVKADFVDPKSRRSH